MEDYDTTNTKVFEQINESKPSFAEVFSSRSQFSRVPPIHNSLHPKTQAAESSNHFKINI